MKNNLNHEVAPARCNLAGATCTSRAFTLVELLVVIAIISILTGIIVTSLSPSKEKANDAEKISDLGQIQLALELYFDRCKRYPTPVPSNKINDSMLTQDTGCPTGSNIKLSTFISKIPTDISADYTYAIAGSPPNDYVLATTLKNNSEILKDDLDGTIHGVNCNDNVYCIGPK